MPADSRDPRDRPEEQRPPPSPPIETYQDLDTSWMGRAIMKSLDTNASWEARYWSLHSLIEYLFGLFTEYLTPEQYASEKSKLDAAKEKFDAVKTYNINIDSKTERGPGVVELMSDQPDGHGNYVPTEQMERGFIILTNQNFRAAAIELNGLAASLLVRLAKLGVIPRQTGSLEGIE